MYRASTAAGDGAAPEVRRGRGRGRGGEEARQMATTAQSRRKAIAMRWKQAKHACTTATKALGCGGRGLPGMTRIAAGC